MLVADPRAYDAPYAAAAVPARSAGAFADRLRLSTLWLVGAVSGFVMIEPAPYEFVIVLSAIVFVATAVAVLLGRRHREHPEMREPFAVLQGALLDVVGLILAFGLSLAVGRYQDRRAAVVDEANAIGTTYLRAQMLAEPVRGRSLALLVQYTDQSIRLSSVVPGSAEAC